MTTETEATTAGSSSGAKGEIHERFQDDGCYGPLNILSFEEAQEAWKEVKEELSVSSSYRKEESAYSRFKLHLFLPRVAAIAHHPKLVEAVQQALGSKDVLLWSSDVNIKPASSDGFFAMHQDSTYAGLVPSTQCLTAWVALSDPVGEAEGCLSFYRQSHKLGQIPHQEKKDGHNMLSLGQYIDSQELASVAERKGISSVSVDSMDWVTIPLRAGQATLHSFYCIHQSGPNKSSISQDRVGLALRYMTSDVRQSKVAAREMVTVVSGPPPTQFDIEPRLPRQPIDDDIARGRQVRAEAMRREEKNYFDLSTTVQSYDSTNLSSEE